MKYLGKTPGRCNCRYCVGDNDSVAMRKAIKHRGRQALKKETDKWTSELYPKKKNERKQT